MATCRGLTPTGWQQAERLAHRLRAEQASGYGEGQGINALYASPIPRARQTATIVATALELPVTVEHDLREPDYGTADAKPWTEAVAAFGVPPALHPDRPIAPGAEPWTTHALRVRATLTAILDRHPGHTVLLVAHGDTIIAAHHHFLALSAEPPGTPTPAGSLAYVTDHTGLTAWEQRPLSWTRPDTGRLWALRTHNDTGHLTSPTSPPTSVQTARDLDVDPTVALDAPRAIP